jgi:hypothetical protein
MSNKSHALPHDVMEFEDERFFEFVKSFAGQKLAALLEFQDINNVNCFLACDDPFELLSYDSNDLLELKKQMCVKLNTNLFVVLPGIKSKMMLLKNALTKKRNDLKKEIPKISSNIMTNNVSSNGSTTDYSSNSTYSSPQQLINNSSSSATSSNSEENLKIHLISLLNDWFDKMEQKKNQKNFQIKEGIDYEIIVNSITNKVFIKCQCGINSTLGQKNNSYVVSHSFHSGVEYHDIRVDFSIFLIYLIKSIR